MVDVTTLPEIKPGPMRWTDLEAMPDDGRRYELVDGVLIVGPSPLTVHQRAVTQLIFLLHSRCPRTMEVFTAPLEVRLSDDTVLEPDVLVALVEDLGQRGLVGLPPQLAVEILSPSTRRFDLTVKKSLLAEAGCPSYWVVDPDEPEKSCSVTVWELSDGAYVECAHAVGEETCSVTLPFPVDITPAALVLPAGRLP